MIITAVGAGVTRCVAGSELAAGLADHCIELALLHPPSGAADDRRNFGQSSSRHPPQRHVGTSRCHDDQSASCKRSLSLPGQSATASSRFSANPPRALQAVCCALPRIRTPARPFGGACALPSAQSVARSLGRSPTCVAILVVPFPHAANPRHSYCGSAWTAACPPR